MRCPECQQEVVLARTCPYCGASVPQPEEPERLQEGKGKDRPRGRFLGRMASDGTGQGAHGAVQEGFLRRLARYMVHPQVPAFSKLLVVLGALYLLSPLDLMPVFLPMGWLDDLGLVAALWLWLNREFTRYL